MLKSIAEKAYYQSYIDGLRGVAILYVLSSHLAHHFSSLSQGSWGVGFVGSFFAAGGLGVPLFFIVSAYTLFGSSLSRIDKDRRPWRNFYLRRVFRILPLWWVMVLIYGSLHGASPRQYFLNLSMLFGFFRFEPQTDLVMVQWSLFVEETFYIFLPLLFSFVRSLKGTVVLFAVTFLLNFVWIRLAPSLGISNKNSFIDFFPFAHWFLFAVGMGLHFLHENSSFKERVLNNKDWGRVLDFVALVWFFVLFREPHPFNSLSVIGVFVAAMHPGSLLGRFTRSKLLGQFGIACYSIYLTHPLLIEISTPILRPLIGGLNNYTSIPLEGVLFILGVPFALVNLLLASIVFRCLEKPMVKLGKKLILHLDERNKNLSTARSAA